MLRRINIYKLRKPTKYMGKVGLTATLLTSAILAAGCGGAPKTIETPVEIESVVRGNLTPEQSAIKLARRELEKYYVLKCLSGTTFRYSEGNDTTTVYPIEISIFPYRLDSKGPFKDYHVVVDSPEFGFPTLDIIVPGDTAQAPFLMAHPPEKYKFPGINENAVTRYKSNSHGTIYADTGQESMDYWLSEKGRTTLLKESLHVYQTRGMSRRQSENAWDTITNLADKGNTKAISLRLYIEETYGTDLSKCDLGKEAVAEIFKKVVGTGEIVSKWMKILLLEAGVDISEINKENTEILKKEWKKLKEEVK